MGLVFWANFLAHRPRPGQGHSSVCRVCNYTIHDISNPSLSQIRYKKKTLASQLVLNCPWKLHSLLKLLWPTPCSSLSCQNTRVPDVEYNYSILFAVRSSPMQRECHSEHHADPLSTLWDGLGMRLDGGLTWECDWLSSKGQKQTQSQHKPPALPDIISVVYIHRSTGHSSQEEEQRSWHQNTTSLSWEQYHWTRYAVGSDVCLSSIYYYIQAHLAKSVCVCAKITRSNLMVALFPVFSQPSFCILQVIKNWTVVGRLL